MAASWSTLTLPTDLLKGISAAFAALGAALTATDDGVEAAKQEVQAELIVAMQDDAHFVHLLTQTGSVELFFDALAQHSQLVLPLRLALSHAYAARHFEDRAVTEDHPDWPLAERQRAALRRDVRALAVLAKNVFNKPTPVVTTRGGALFSGLDRYV